MCIYNDLICSIVLFVQRPFNFFKLFFSCYYCTLFVKSLDFKTATMYVGPQALSSGFVTAFQVKRFDFYCTIKIVQVN